MFRNYDNWKCQNCNTMIQWRYPGCSMIENKPFGSEMCNGRGICDTDPIPKHGVLGLCNTHYQPSESITTAKMTMNSPTSGKYPRIQSKLMRLPNFSSSNIKSPTEKKFFKDPKIAHKDPLDMECSTPQMKLAGPYTEPPNPGKQMKLGEPYYEHQSVEMDFYADF